MSLLLDIILLIVMVFSAVFYYRKGFAASVVGLLRFVIAFVLSVMFSGLLADVFQPAVSKALPSGGGESFFSMIGEKMVNSGYVAYVLAFALIFLLSLLVVKLIEFLLRTIIQSLPVIGTFDHLLGGLVGILAGFFWAQLLTELYVALAHYASGGFFSAEVFNDTVLAKFLYDYNLFGLIFKAITGT